LNALEVTIPERLMIVGNDAGKFASLLLAEQVMQLLLNFEHCRLGYAKHQGMICSP